MCCSHCTDKNRESIYLGQTKKFKYNDKIQLGIVFKINGMICTLKIINKNQFIQKFCFDLEEL